MYATNPENHDARSESWIGKRDYTDSSIEQNENLPEFSTTQITSISLNNTGDESVNDILTEIIRENMERTPSHILHTKSPKERDYIYPTGEG